jgi:hypothetical protein
MMAPLYDAAHWALVLGMLTLTCWLAAGLVAVVGTPEEIRHSETGKASYYATAFLTGVGVASALAMIAILLLA